MILSAISCSKLRNATASSRCQGHSHAIGIHQILYIKEHFRKKSMQLHILDMFHQFGRCFFHFSYFTFISYLVATCWFPPKKHSNMSKPWPNLHLHLLQLPTLPFWASPCDLFRRYTIFFCLVVSIHLKNMRKSNWIISPKFGMKIKNVWVATT